MCLTIGLLAVGICAARLYLYGPKGSGKGQTNYTNYPLMYTREILVSNILFCQELKLEFTGPFDEDDDNVSVYMLDSPPSLTGRKKLYMTEDFGFINKVNFSYSYAANDMYPGSTINMSICLFAGGTSVSIFVFLGKFYPSVSHLDLNNPTDTLTTPCLKGRQTFFYRVTSNKTFNVVFVTFAEDYSEHTINIIFNYDLVVYEPRQDATVLSTTTCSDSSLSCLVPVPINSAGAYFSTLSTPRVSIDDDVSMWISCGLQRRWLYMTIVGAVTLLLEVLVITPFVVFICCLQFRDNKEAERERKRLLDRPRPTIPYSSPKPLLLPPKPSPPPPRPPSPEPRKVLRGFIQYGDEFIYFDEN